MPLCRMICGFSLVLIGANSTWANNVHVQNCMTDKQTHEFVAQSVVIKKQGSKEDIPYTQNLELNCEDDGPDGCGVKVHGSSRWFTVVGQATFYGDHDVAYNAYDEGCSKNN